LDVRIVLVHGILDTGSKFKVLQPYLEARGHVCLAPSLSPNDGRDGLPALAEQLKAEIDAAFGPDESIGLIGFSMGGLICRWYLQALGGHTRVDPFIAISVPMRGTIWAYAYPGEGARQMRPGSDFLSHLAATVDRLDRLNLFAYWTPYDAVIVPQASADWALADSRRIPALCHPCMLWHDELLADVAAQLAGG
jgi:triacylglycerol lipase